MNFNKVIARLTKVPRAQRMALYLGLFVIGLVAYWLLFYLPAQGTIDQLAENQLELEKQQQQVEARVKNKQQYETEVGQLEEELKEAVKALPSKREIPRLLKATSELGKKVGLEIRKFKPLPETRRDYVAEVPVSLEVQGGYHEVAMFFDRLSKMSRIVYVQDIEMAEPVERSGQVSLTVTGNVVTFRFLTDEELAESSAAGKKGGKGRRRRRGG